MWKKLALCISVLALGLAVACGEPTTEDVGDDDDDNATPTPSGTATPTPTPTPAMTYDLTFNGTGFTPHSNQIGGVHVYDSTGTAVAGACGNDQTIDMNGAFAYGPFADVLVEGQDYTVEVWASLNDNNNTYDAGDHNWIYTYTAVAADVVLNSTHGDGQTALVNQAAGTGCP